MHNQCILFLTDNEALVSVINKQTSKDSDLMTFVRKLVLTLLTQFHSHILNEGSVGLPVSPSVLALFIAYLFNLNYAPSTVNTYVSAIGYSHRLSNLPDPTRVFLHCTDT